MNLGRHVTLTILALTPAWIISLLTDNLGFILELVGALGSITLGKLLKYLLGFKSLNERCFKTQCILSNHSRH